MSNSENSEDQDRREDTEDDLVYYSEDWEGWDDGEEWESQGIRKWI